MIAIIGILLVAVIVMGLLYAALVGGYLTWMTLVIGAATLAALILVGGYHAMPHLPARWTRLKTWIQSRWQQIVGGILIAVLGVLVVMFLFQLASKLSGTSLMSPIGSTSSIASPSTATGSVVDSTFIVEATSSWSDWIDVPLGGDLIWERADPTSTTPYEIQVPSGESHIYTAGATERFHFSGIVRRVRVRVPPNPTANQTAVRFAITR